MAKGVTSDQGGAVTRQNFQIQSGDLNGSESSRIAAAGSITAYIELGSPWENGDCESFNAKLRDELFNGEVFYTLKEASVVIEQWRRHCNTLRPHSSLGYHPPAPEVVI